MKATIVKNEKSVATVAVVAETEEWKAAQDKAFKKLKSKLKIDGFAHGDKVPDAMARKHINPNDLMNESINAVLPDLYEKMLKETNITPFMNPSVNITKYSNEEFEVTFEIPTYPEVTLGKYKGLSVELETIVINDTDVENEIKLLANRNADLAPAEADHVAALGDTLVFDFKGFVDGKAFDGGTADNYSLELGSGQFIPGFEDQLVGTKAGEHKTVKVTFPEQYVKELAGKDATFECDVHEIKTKVIPEINDEFAAGLAIEGVTDLATLKEHEKKELTARRESSAKTRQMNKLIEMIVNDSQVELSDAIVDREIEGMKQQLEQRIAQNGLTMEQYLEISNTTEEQLNEQFKSEAAKNLKTYLTISKISEVENIKVTQEDIDKEFENMSAQYGMSVEEIKKAIGDNVRNIASNIHEQKFNKFLAENNKL